MAVYFGSEKISMVGGTRSVDSASGNYQTKTVTPTEQAITVSPDGGYDALDKVVINAIAGDYVGSDVPRKSSASFTPKSTSQVISANQFLTGNQTINPVPVENKIITVNGTYSPSDGKFFDEVTVNVSGQAVNLGKRTIISNGVYNASSDGYDGFSSVTVNVPSNETSINLQEKNITPTESIQSVSADSGFDGLSKVNIGGISPTYIGSQVPKKNAASYTPNDSTQTITAGTYLSGNQTIKPVPTETKSITSNGTYTASSGNYFKTVTVSVPSDSQTFNTQEKTISPTEQSQKVTPDAGYDALSSVNVNGIPPTYIGSGITKKATQTYTPNDTTQTIAKNVYLTGDQIINPVTTETKTISANGTYTPAVGTYFNSITVSVPSSSQEFNTQSKTVTPSETAQEITPDVGYDGLSSVSVNAIPNTYIGSGVVKRTSADLTSSGATVTVPSGYYSSLETKSVATATLATPTISVSTSGLITATENQGTSGYISSGTKTATQQLTTKGAASYTPNGTTQTIASGTFLTGTQTINPVPTETRNITPTSSQQTITPTSGKYFSSVVVAGDTNLNGANIISGKSIFGVSGQVVIQKYYTGTSTPAATLGANGDLYLQPS